MLSDEYVLYTKTRNYHWNVTGPQFHDLHRFLRGSAFGTLAEFSRDGRLTQYLRRFPKAREMVANLQGDHKTTIHQLPIDLDTCADQYHDVATNNFLTGVDGKA